MVLCFNNEYSHVFAQKSPLSLCSVGASASCRNRWHYNLVGWNGLLFLSRNLQPPLDFHTRLALCFAWFGCTINAVRRFSSFGGGSVPVFVLFVSAWRSLVCIPVTPAKKWSSFANSNGPSNGMEFVWILRASVRQEYIPHRNPFLTET